MVDHYWNDGGTLHIGIDDSGSVVGVVQIKKLLKELPNKILSKLGIIARVEPEEKSGKETVKITIERMDVPISYNGRYFVRAGSTRITIISSIWAVPTISLWRSRGLSN